MIKKAIAPWLRNVIEKKERFHRIIDSVRDITSTGGKAAEEYRLKNIKFLQTGVSLFQVEEILGAISKGVKK